jgi:hypothetical protein
MIARSRAALAWTLLLFVGTELALYAFLSHAHPELRDPEYGSLLTDLQQRVAEAPGRPLVLVLGSSRFANVFRPSAVPAPLGVSPEPVVFNFSTLSTGPLRELQMLRRLLDEGFRPRWVVAEVWPLYLTQRKGFAEEKYIADRDLLWPDAPLIADYFADPWPAYRKLWTGILAPAAQHSHRLLVRYAPFLKPEERRAFGDWSDPSLRKEGSGWLPAPVARPEPELFRAIIAKTVEAMPEAFEDFRISNLADKALREIAQTCRQNDMGLVLVLAPEHSSLRDCYPPEVEARVLGYLRDLGRDCQVPLVNARDWVGDEDFLDMTHALPQAAAPLTRRFAREVLRPLLEGVSLDAGHGPLTFTGPGRRRGRDAGN